VQHPFPDFGICRRALIERVFEPDKVLRHDYFSDEV
jgi:hypothetical protein